MQLSSPGLGSGLDVNGIVAQLMSIEQQPLNRLNQKEAEFQAQISTYGALKGGFSSLQDALKPLTKTETFHATKASSSNPDLVTVSSDSTAVSSSYSVTVNRLAQQHKLGSSEFAGTATFGGNAGDELILTSGTNSFTVDLSTAKTLAEIQTSINAETNSSGVTASLITGDSGNQTLVLNSSGVGFENRVQLSFGGTLSATTFNFSMLNTDGNGVLLASENDLDASLTIDGVAITRSSNSINDAISGLTLDLIATGQITASVVADSSVATGAVEEFVNAFNTLKDQIREAGAGSANGSVLRSMESQLRGVLNTALSGLGEYSYISELGVTTNANTGKLEFDSDALSTALKENPGSVASFLGDENSGLMAKFDGLLEGFVTAGGTIDSFIQGANNRIDSITLNRASLERRLESIEAGLFRQFGALDTLMASMSTTSDFLGRQLDALANMVGAGRR